MSNGITENRNVEMYKEVLSHAEMTIIEGLSLQKGMNFRPLSKKYSIFLMSVRENAPYADGFTSEGSFLIYEGHDINRREHPNPKAFDQPFFTKNGKTTENGKFFKCAEDYLMKRMPNPERIRVYEKITSNVWSDKGFFFLVDAYTEPSEDKVRKVFKFKLSPEKIHLLNHELVEEAEFSRRIPTSIKKIVWDRDDGKCIECGSNKDLHFDHILPYSKGGTSTSAKNIQLLCQKHNLTKSDKII